MVRKKKEIEEPPGTPGHIMIAPAPIKPADYQLRPESRGTPYPETAWERYAETRIQALEKELQTRHQIIEALVERLGGEVSRKYSSHNWYDNDG